MKLPSWLDTRNIEAQFVIANTPNFIVRRLKEDKVPYLLSKSMAPDQLLKLFIETSRMEPENLRELVTPYICLSALSLLNDGKYLKDAQTFTSAAHHQYKWLRAYTQILIDTFRPTSFVAMKARVIDNSVAVGTASSMNYVSRRFPQ
jgi:hypothetical protein